MFHKVENTKIVHLPMDLRQFEVSNTLPVATL